MKVLVSYEIKKHYVQQCAARKEDNFASQTARARQSVHC